MACPLTLIAPDLGTELATQFLSHLLWEHPEVFVTGISAYFIYRRLRLSGELATTEFEDKLNREYRELARDIPAKALLGDDLSSEEYHENFENFLYYIDLCNEQAFLRKEGQVSLDSWESWCEGINSNLDRQAFSRAWQEVKRRSDGSYAELRGVRCKRCCDDPKEWDFIDSRPENLCSQSDDEQGYCENCI